ncbi:hypothetical protein Vafri_5012 [Volvox africanus]|uniref:Uncharacterized protein n=1 Tax=Volvox africanus TaxID=51714 RepID=A0A8J4AV32_9CHLO|nr:hypothetical protein Vafri_5012 [Volvox africanus]
MRESLCSCRCGDSHKSGYATDKKREMGICRRFRAKYGINCCREGYSPRSKGQHQLPTRAGKASSNAATDAAIERLSATSPAGGAASDSAGASSKRRRAASGGMAQAPPPHSGSGAFSGARRSFSAIAPPLAYTKIIVI